MRLAKLASFVHKWLALLIGLQIVFWVVSGAFFTLYPIEQIRSEHRIREVAPVAIDFAHVGSLSGFSSFPQRPTKLTVERRGARQVIVAEFGEGRPALFDAATLQRLSPLDAQAAAQIAQAHVLIDETPRSVAEVTRENPEYRGALPAWRVNFETDGLAVYVAADTGQVTARRSDLWRFYDAMWALHIMDWQNHEDFNHPLIVIVGFLTLVSVIAGIVLIPYRIRFGPKAASKPS